MLIPLKESCLRILTAHSSGLKDVGNCVYDLIRPVLFACPPDQLAEIEDLSPHLMLESDEIWLLHLQRDYPHECKSQTPQSESISYPTSIMNPYTNQETDLPPNRIKYYTIKESKAKALANASARLRERTQANRSEFSKRKAIFTGETDRGQFRNKRLNLNHRGSSSSSYQSKSLADKARQQVKKSCAVYANASRLKTPSGSQALNASSSSTRPIGSTSSASSIHPPTSSSSASSTPRSHVHNPNIVVKVVPPKPINPPDPSTRIIKPTPFRSNSKAPLIKVVRPIIPIPRSSSTTTASSSKESLPIIGSSSNLNSHKPNPPSNPNPNSNPNPPSTSTPNPKKPSSLFMPKTKKPPPPTPLRSIVSVPLPQSSTTTRMSRPPPPPVPHKR